MKASMHKGSRASVTSGRNEQEIQEDLFVDGAVREAADSAVNKSHISESEMNDELLPVKQEKTGKFGIATEEVAEVPKKKGCCSCNMTPFILMIALSVHAMFEGLALGLTTDFQSTLNIVIAIVIHKGAASSSLGISLVKTFPDDFTTVRWLIFIFSCASPLGVVIGMIASGAGEIVQIVCTSLAAGSFIYIACSEVIVQEFSMPGNRWWKLLFFLMGATIISSLFFIE